MPVATGMGRSSATGRSNWSSCAATSFHWIRSGYPISTRLYDRASLIAMAQDLRAQYAAHMKNLLRPGLQALLITLTYRDGEINPPPFRVFREEVESLYDPWCDVELLQEGETEVKGIMCPQFAYRLRVR